VLERGVEDAPRVMHEHCRRPSPIHMSIRKLGSVLGLEEEEEEVVVVVVRACLRHLLRDSLAISNSHA
jgi:hypothetical protein